PASTSASISGRLTYFVAATIVTSGPTSALTCSYRARISAGESTDHPLGAVDAPARTVREEAIVVAAGAEIEALHGCHPGAPEGALGSRPEVEHPALRELGGEPGCDL